MHTQQQLVVTVAAHLSGANVVMPAHKRGPATSEGMESGILNAKSAQTVMQVA